MLFRWHRHIESLHAEQGCDHMSPSEAARTAASMEAGCSGAPAQDGPAPSSRRPGSCRQHNRTCNYQLVVITNNLAKQKVVWKGKSDMYRPKVEMRNTAQEH